MRFNWRNKMCSTSKTMKKLTWTMVIGHFKLVMISNSYGWSPWKSSRGSSKDPSRLLSSNRSHTGGQSKMDIVYTRRRLVFTLSDRCRSPAATHPSYSPRFSSPSSASTRSSVRAGANELHVQRVAVASAAMGNFRRRRGLASVVRRGCL